MQIKATMSDHFPSVRMAVTKKTRDNKHLRGGEEKVTLVYS